MKDLLECGVHFGHQTRKWNPKMKKFIYGVRKNIYIIDLQKSLRYFRYTYNLVRESASKGETMIFVGTKKQARDAIQTAATNCDMPYVNNRWLGGMLTNHDTIKKGLRKLEIIRKMKEEGQIDLLTKKEALMLSRKELKLEAYLGGIKDMKKMPNSMFVIDPVKEKIAILEAKRLGIKVYAPLDTNCDPDMVDFPIPGNDDAIRSIELFCNEISNAINEGRAIYAEENDQEFEYKTIKQENTKQNGDKQNIDKQIDEPKTDEQTSVEKPKAKKEAEPKAEPKAETKAEPKAKKEAKPKAEPKAKPKAKKETEPKAKKKDTKTTTTQDDKQIDEPKKDEQTSVEKPKAEPKAKKEAEKEDEAITTNTDKIAQEEQI